MSRILAIALVFGLGVIPQAGADETRDYQTRQNVPGQPRYGTTTTDPRGNQWQTRDTQFGQPQYGKTTTGPNGQTCVTTDKQFGQPQYGQTTVCR